MSAHLSLVPDPPPSSWWDDLPPEIQKGAMKVAERAAAKALPKSWTSGGDHWSTLIRREDLLAEALSLLVLDDGDLRELLEVEGDPEYGLLHFRLYRDLLNVVDVHRRAGAGATVTSYEEYTSRDDDGTVIEGPWVTPKRVAVMQDRCNTSSTPVSTYDESQVETLAPTIANLMHYDALMGEVAPDRDMPAGMRSPSTGGNLLVSAIDVRRAWKLAPLTPKQREAFRSYYVDDPRRGDRNEDVRFMDVGKSVGCSGEVARRRVDAAMRKLLTFLNGAEPAEAVGQTGELEVAA